MKKYVIKAIEERDDGNDYLFNCSPVSVDWTSLFHAKKFDTKIEAEIFIKKNFILNSRIISIQVRR